jgi:threonine dehydrogenase-like Zn-dependent dehydrogenase
MCLSTYKAVSLGPDHKRVPDDVADNPTMTGHEFAGVIAEVGANLADRYHVGQHVAIQPALGLPTGESPGYSYPYYGGDATYTIVPKVAVDHGCVLPYDDDYFANASLAEPMMCIIGAFHSNFHTTQFVYSHDMGIRPGGKVAILGVGGPMGMGAIQYALAGPYKPSLVVAADIDGDRLRRLEELIPTSSSPDGTELVYLDTSKSDPVALLQEACGGAGYDDVFVFVPSRALLETADEVLGTDGCLNFFAGPTDQNFKAEFNFYKVHYETTHVVGTSGGSADDMRESLRLSAEGRINPSMMVTHIGGLDSVPSAVLDLPVVPGGKRLIYPQISLPLTAISDFAELGKEDPLFARLTESCEAHDGLWNREAEAILREALEPKEGSLA